MTELTGKDEVRVRRQLAIAISPAFAKAACRYVIAIQRGTSERARKKTELTGKDEVKRLRVHEKRRKLIQLVAVLINSTDRLQQPYVRTQLAIATASIMNLNNKTTTKVRQVNNIICLLYTSPSPRD